VVIGNFAFAYRRTYGQQRENSSQAVADPDDPLYRLAWHRPVAARLQLSYFPPQ
jgi:hypothetical protein